MGLEIPAGRARPPRPTRHLHLPPRPNPSPSPSVLRVLCSGRAVCSPELWRKGSACGETREHGNHWTNCPRFLISRETEAPERAQVTGLGLDLRLQPFKPAPWGHLHIPPLPKGLLAVNSGAFLLCNKLGGPQSQAQGLVLRQEIPHGVRSQALQTDRLDLKLDSANSAMFGGKTISVPKYRYIPCLIYMML